MAIPSLLGSYIDQTYQRLVQVSGSEFADGLGNPITFGTTVPGGSNTQIQFNSGNTFAGNDAFTFNYINHSFQQGFNVTASGQYSHAEGLTTYAIGDRSHVEGESTFTGQYGYYSSQISSGVIILNPTANDISFLFSAGSYIVLEDTGGGLGGGLYIFEVLSATWDGTNVTINLVDTTVSTSEARIGILGVPNPMIDVSNTLGGLSSHAEGESTIALGFGSHAEGYNTITFGQYQHVQGQFNTPIPDQSAFIIGNGTNNSNRSNLLVATGNEIQITGSVKITLNNADYVNTNGANSHILLSNPNPYGQNVLSSYINENLVAKWRTDYVGNINWIAGSGGSHAFYTNGDFGVGESRMAIFNNGNVSISNSGVGGSNIDSGYKLDVNGTVRFTNELTVSSSVTINDVLTLPPVSPLPSGKPVGSFAVSGSGVNCKPYFYNGTTWTPLF